MKTLMLAALALAMAGCAQKQVELAEPEPLGAVGEMHEYVVPWENAFPSDIAVDSAGRVWFTDRLTHVIGMFDPGTGEFRSQRTPTPRAAPYGLIVAPDGTLWFCESTVGQLGRIDPATGAITEHAIPDATGGLHLLTWRSGEIWFSMREASSFGRFDPRTGASTVYRLQRERPYSVTATADAVWMNSYGSFRLLQVDPATGTVRVHDLSTVPDPVDSTMVDLPAIRRPRRAWGGEVRRIAAAADGRIWFTDFGRSRVVRYDPVAGELDMFPSVEARSEPYGLALTGRGHLWYSERGAGHVTVLDPVRNERVRVRVPSAPSHARHIVVDEKRGRVWFPLSDVGRIGMVEYR